MMFKNTFYKKLTLGLLVFSIVTTSWGSAFATSALAAAPEEEIQEVQSADNSANTRNTVLAGLLGIGLIAALSNSGDDGNSNTPPAKNTAPIPSTSGSVSTTPSTQLASRIAADEQSAFNLLNADRAANGLAPLKLNLAVTAVAGRHAQDEINRNFFAHNNPDGLSPFDRMRTAGISFSYAGENLAINRDVASAEKAFMNSSGHRANILNSNYTEVGIGVRYNSQGSAYVVQNFISR